MARCEAESLGKYAFIEGIYSDCFHPVCYSPIIAAASLNLHIMSAISYLTRRMALQYGFQFQKSDDYYRFLTRKALGSIH